MERRSLAEYLADFLRRGKETAYVQAEGYRRVRWSYRAVAETAYQFARDLESRGIAKGDRVLLWAPNSAEWVIAFLGCCLRGVVVVPIDDVTQPDFALRVFEQVDAKLLIASREHIRPDLPSLAMEDLKTAVQGRSAVPFPGAEIDPGDPLQIVFTSGTTAEPRGVVITHGNVLANIAPLESEIQKYLKYERFVHPVRLLNLLPLSHVFGQFLGIFLPQLLGGTVVLQNTLRPTEIISVVRRERVSVLVAVPRVLESLKDKIERDLEAENRLQQFRCKFQSAEGEHFLRRWWIFRQIRRRFGWKFWAFISGGAALDASTEQFWDRLGYAVIQGYGLTETTSLISVNHPFRLSKRSIGKVLNGREVKLAEDGEILVRGAGVAAGYFSGAEPHPITDEVGWYRTGDLGEMDAAGNLYFKGRKKNVIVTSGGMNVYPDDLEAILRVQPEVKDAVVVSRPRGENAEPCAVLLLRDSADAALVVKRVNESLAEYQRINSWLAWPEQDFPRTSTQKPRRNVIEDFARAHWQRASGTVVPGSLGDLIGKITGRSGLPLSPQSDLDSDLNLSSLDRVELLSALEDRYQLDLSETRFAAVRTVGDLDRILRGGLPGQAAFHYPSWSLSRPVQCIRLCVHYLLLRPAVFLLGWPHVLGRENLEECRGPVLVICNHLGDVDPGFVLTALPPHLRHRLAIAAGGEALEVLRSPGADRGVLRTAYDRVKWMLGVSLLNLFPLPREAGFRESFAYAGECVDRGYSVLVFPEGRHTPDGKLLPFRAGIGLLANNLHIPVVPMRIDGLFERKRAGKKFALPGQITVRIGKPVQFARGADPAQIAVELQQKVASL